MEKITAGRDYLGQLAPDFAAINDDVLFGKLWENEAALSPKLRSMITISALIGAGITDQSLKGHLEMGKAHGITKAEIVAIVTQLAFYTGWPKGWSVFSLIQEVYKEDADAYSLFGAGEETNDHEHFNGKVYVKEILGFDYPMLADTVTFEPGCRNNWHVHQVGQVLFVTDGIGWYQEEGKTPQKLKAGDVVRIPGGVKHWHGAAAGSWFSHLAMEDWSKGQPEWLEPLSDEEYARLEKNEK